MTIRSRASGGRRL